MSYIGKSPGIGVRSRYYFTATGGETSLSGTDDNGATLLFSDGTYVDVMLNGINLVAGTDYNTTTANTIGGLAALSASDVVEIVVYDVFSVADTVSKTNGGTFDGAVVFGSTTTHQDAATFESTTTHQGAATFQSTATFQDEVVIDTGTTAERPASPATGSVRYNTTLELYEGYNGKEWTALSATKTPDVYTIDNSLRFNDDDSAYLSRTPASAGDSKTWTFSAWIKRAGISASAREGILTCVNSGGTDYTGLEIEPNGLRLYDNNAGGAFLTSGVFRDPSAWYHVVLHYDTTQATSTERMKLYVNGVQVTEFSAITYPTLNADTRINTTNQHSIGSWSPNATLFPFDGYMSDVYFIDGQALDPTSFGEFDDNGVWNPIAFAGTYGTNGFFLEFKTDSALGTDTSGNGNDWTPSGIVASDQMTDTPTVNYTTLNPLTSSSAFTLSNGSLDVSDAGSASSVLLGSIAVNSGKWYWEVTLGNQYAYVGAATVSSRSSVAYLGAVSGQFMYNTHVTSSSQVNGSIYNYSTAATATTGDVIGVALDFDTNAITFYKNGVSQGVFSSGILGSETWAPAFKSNSSTSASFNFGQRPFTYTPPTGFVALSSANLPTPAIADGKEHFEPLLWTGNGSTQAIGGLEFSPDLVWIKSRSNNYDHQLHDTVRGPGSTLFSNENWAEGTYNTITSFDSSGFTVDGSTYAGTNGNGSTFVGWSWNAGGSTVTNTNGTRTAQVRANTDAGFSIVSYNPALTSGQSCTVGHGLSQAPEIIISKSRSHVYNWWTYTTIIDGSVDYLALNLTNAGADDIYGLAITNSTFTQDYAYTGSSSSHISYCFHSVDGFSKFGTYTGNGSADGPFVYTGFRPAFLLIKNTTTAGYNWIIADSKRNPNNVMQYWLYPNLANAEAAADRDDLLSNGFKIRQSGAGVNASGSTYIYMAFAENPFKTARAR